MEAQTVKTRVIILSDTHNKKPCTEANSTLAYRAPLPHADLLLHAGDLTRSGKLIEHKAQIEMMKDHPAELKIIVPGNHDITLDKSYYANKQWSHLQPEDTGVIEELYTGPAAKQAGIVLMKEGVQSFRLSNGAKFTVYASAYQPEFCGWAFAYKRDQDRFNPAPAVSRRSGGFPPNPIPSHPEIDIVVTHGPPHGILDKVLHMSRQMDSSVGCHNLLQAVKRCRPRLHAFGHIHEGWGAERMKWSTLENSADEKEKHRSEIDKDKVFQERAAFLDVSSGSEHPLRFGQETLFINASIMNVNYIPSNAPWIVDLDLPLA